MEDPLPLFHPQETSRLVAKFEKIAPNGIFSTGIENSDPWVEGKRRNELIEAYDFPQNFARRLENIKSLGITWVRFGMGYSQVAPKKGFYDFELTDKVIAKCEELGMTVIADLLHFGLPEWIHESSPDKPFFQNSAFPEEFAKYVRTFTKRYPQIKYFTPVNEPLVTAVFSARNAMWNEALGGNWEDDRVFIQAVANVAKAAILAKKEIRKVWEEEGREGEPIFFQNDSFEKSVAAPHSGREAEADRFNLGRFSALDLILGHRDEEMEEFLLSQNLTKEQYEWFMENGDTKQTVLGIDHYPMCTHFLYPEGEIVRSKVQPYELEVVVKEYWNRYRLPLLHMEVNASPDTAIKICQETYDILSKLKTEGYPVLGMAWFGDEYQVGWQSGLMGEDGHSETRVGLFYKGEREAVADLFKDLSRQGLPSII